ALGLIYIAFSAVFLNLPVSSFALVFFMHGPVWNLLIRNLKAFGIESDWFPSASIAAQAERPEPVGYVSRDRAEAFATALTEVYGIAAETGMNDGALYGVLAAVADPRYDADRYLAGNPRALAWVKRLRAEFADLMPFVTIGGSSRYAGIDIVFDDKGDAIMLTGQSGAGKGSLSKALQDLQGDRRLSIGSEDYSYLFDVGGFRFAASGLPHAEGVFRARAYGGDLNIQKTLRVGIVRGTINLSRSDRPGYTIAQRSAANLRDLTETPTAPDMNLLSPVQVLDVSSSLTTPEQYAALAADVYARLYGRTTSSGPTAATAGSDEAAIASRLADAVKAGDEQQALLQAEKILTEGSSPSVGVGETTQANRPAANFNPLRIANLVAQDLEVAVRRDRLDAAKVRPALTVLAALLANTREERAGIVDLEQRPLMSTANESSPTEVYRWLEGDDAATVAAEWRRQEHNPGDRLVLLVPAARVAALQETLGGRDVQFLAAEDDTNVGDLLRRSLGSLDESTVGARRFRFLVNKGRSLPEGFFDLNRSNLPAAVRASLQRSLEVYLILSAVQAVRVEGDRLRSFEALRLVLIQA
ncbi:MAG: hypothetical protein JO102_03670, partial [Elusimicrobia bacterium]|nr:hypothetical protein [Elusimicrobiota bacterium]